MSRKTRSHVRILIYRMWDISPAYLSRNNKLKTILPNFGWVNKGCLPITQTHREEILIY